jgi:hypothetical protein
MCFDAIHIFLVSGFAFYINAYAHLFSLLLIYACLFEFVWAKALASALFAVSFSYDCFNVMHLFASFFLVVSVSTCITCPAARAGFL